MTIDVRKVIKQDIRHYVTKKQKSVALLFPLLITGICEASGVKFVESDEWVKNEGALITRTVERIARDSVATITPEHPLVIKSVKATGFRKILQDLSDRLNAWKEEQKEEIKGVSVLHRLKEKKKRCECIVYFAVAGN